MKRILLASAFLSFVLPIGASGGSGEWKVWCNKSAINRITVAGDSIWCSTRGGILVMNLVDSTFVDHLDGLGFRSTEVTALTIDRRGSVWAGFASTGVARIDRFAPNPSVKLYSSVIDGLVSDSVTCMVSVGEDVYYGTRNGAAKFFENFPSYETVLTDSLQGVEVNDILAREDTLYLACNLGVARFERSTFAFRMDRIGRSLSLCVHEGKVHAATVSGVKFLAGGMWNSLGMPGGYVPIGVAAGSGVLYAITEGRAFRWSGSSWSEITANMKTLFSQKYKIFSNYNVPKTIAVDRRGTLWLAGYEPQLDRGAYLNYFSGTGWQSKSPTELTQNGIIALSLGENRDLWASTRHFGVSLLRDDGNWLQYTKLRTPLDPAGFSYFSFMFAFLCDSRGNLWCNVLGNDLDRVEINDPGSQADDVWHHYALHTGTITSNRFVRIKEDPAGNRWFLSDDVVQGMSGINILSSDGTKWMSVDPTIEPRMAGGSVFDVSFSGSGTAYLAIRNYGLQAWATGGFSWENLSNLSNDVWTTLIGPEDLASKTVYCCERGNDGSVWLGTASGLVRYRSGVVDSITVKTSPGAKGLLGAQVYDLEYDGSGNLWVATDRGLNMIDPQGNIEAYTTFSAWQANLYPSSVISPLPSAVCQALVCDVESNFLWIGTAGGLARLDVSPREAVKISLEKAILYPNPVHLARGDSALRISKISSPVSIRVFTLEGELVHEAENVVEGAVAWDLLTLNGYKAVSGIYLVRVSDGRNSIVRKIAVLR